MRPHHSLDAWKKSIDFVVEIYKMIAYRMGYLEKRDHETLDASLNDIGRMITGLSNHLKRKQSRIS